MAAHSNGQAIICCSCGYYLSSFFFFLAYSQRSQIRCLPYFHTWCDLDVNLECTFEMCCTWLAGNAGHKDCHLRTIAQLCWAISSLLRHVSTIGKKLVKQQYLLHMSWTSAYNGWDLLASLGHPCKFQRVSHLGSVTARHLVVGVSQTLGRWTEGATYIQQGGHNVGRPTF